MKRSLHLLRNAQVWLLLSVYTWLGLSSHPPSVFDTSHDLSLHFIANLALFFSASLGWRHKPGHLLTWLFLFAFTLSVEIAQLLVPERYLDWRDVLANAGGLTTGMAAVLILKRHGFFRGLNSG